MGLTVALASSSRPRFRGKRYLAPVALALLLAAVVVIASTSAVRSRGHSWAARSRPHLARLPPYWIVRAGDTLAQISQRTGLTIGRLEAFNPDADPLALIPGERLNLWQHPPAPRPKPPGPRFWIVRPGQSLGSIAASTGINLATLEQLNPRLAPNTLQPGDRVRLRPELRARSGISARN